MVDLPVKIETYTQCAKAHYAFSRVIRRNNISRYTLSHDDMVRLAKLLILSQSVELPSLSHILRDNEEVVLAALKYDGRYLEYASDRLRNNISIVYAAVLADKRSSCIPAYRYASDEIRANKKVATLAGSINHLAIKDAPYKFRDDKEFALGVFSKSKEWLIFYKNLIECGRPAGECNHWMEREELNTCCTLRLLSYHMRDDEDVIMVAVKYFDRPIKSASHRIQEIVSSIKDGDTAFEKLRILKKGYAKSARK